MKRAEIVETIKNEIIKNHRLTLKRKRKKKTYNKSMAFLNQKIYGFWVNNREYCLSSSKVIRDFYYQEGVFESDLSKSRRKSYVKRMLKLERYIYENNNELPDSDQGDIYRLYIRNKENFIRDSNIIRRAYFRLEKVWTREVNDFLIINNRLPSRYNVEEIKLRNYLEGKRKLMLKEREELYFYEKKHKASIDREIRRIIRDEKRLPNPEVFGQKEEDLYYYFSLAVKDFYKASDGHSFLLDMLADNFLFFAVIKFVYLNKRLPRVSVEEERQLASCYHRNKHELQKNKLISFQAALSGERRIKEMRKKYVRKVVEGESRQLKEIISILKNEDRFITQMNESESYLYSWYLRNRDIIFQNLEFKELYKRIRRKEDKEREKLERSYASAQHEVSKALMSFMHKNRKLPDANKESERSLYRDFKNRRELLFTSKAFENLYLEITSREYKLQVMKKEIELGVNVKVNTIKDFIKKNNRMLNMNIEEERYLYKWFHHNKEYVFLDKEVKSLYEEIENKGFKKAKSEDDIKLGKHPKIKELIVFISENKRLPRRLKGESGLRDWFYKNKALALTNKELNKLHEEINGGTSFDRKLKELTDFIKKNGRMASHKDASEKKLYTWLVRNRKKAMLNEPFKVLYESVK